MKKTTGILARVLALALLLPLLTAAVGASVESVSAFEGSAFGKWLDSVFYGADMAIYRLVAPLRTQGWTDFWNAYTHLGSFKAAMVVLVIGLGLCLFPKTRRAGMSTVFAIAIGGLVVNLILKNLCGRARPYVTLAANEEYMAWYRLVGSPLESDNSFPSGHTNCAMEIAVALWLGSRRRKLSWLWLVAGLAVAFSRIYIAVHYPTDVFAGLLCGVFAGVMGFLIADRLMKQPKIAAWAPLKKKAA